jgi:hypothetical protein
VKYDWRLGASCHVSMRVASHRGNGSHRFMNSAQDMAEVDIFLKEGRWQLRVATAGGNCGWQLRVD